MLHSLRDNVDLHPKDSRLLARRHPFQTELSAGELHGQLHINLEQRHLLSSMITRFLYQSIAAAVDASLLKMMCDGGDLPRSCR